MFYTFPFHVVFGRIAGTITCIKIYNGWTKQTYNTIRFVKQ
jgi:hypothetical protein